jgi:hypothetical protein
MEEVANKVSEKTTLWSLICGVLSAAVWIAVWFVVGQTLLTIPAVILGESEIPDTLGLLCYLAAIILTVCLSKAFTWFKRRVDGIMISLGRAILRFERWAKGVEFRSPWV